MSKAALVAKPLRLNITVTKGPNAGPALSFQQQLITVGRGPENQIVLSQDPKISRNHLEFHVSSNSIFFRNLSQRNAAAINGEIVHEKILMGSTLLAVGDSELLIEAPEMPKESSINSLKVVTGSGGTHSGALQKKETGNAQNFQAAGQFGAPGSFGQAGSFNQNGQYAAGATPAAESPLKDLFANPKARFYMIVAVVLLGGIWLFNGNETKKKQEIKLRDSVQSNEDFVKSEAEVQRMRDDPKFKAKDSIQFQKADEHYTRGFRDYTNGQYVRAIEGFQAALSFYPSHELARRYYSLAVRKFDQTVQGHMVRGRQYYGKKNYQKCISEFRSVVIMKKDPRDAVRKEALQLHDECRLRLEEGR